MANQRQLNGGKQGSGSGLDADSLDGKESDQIGTPPAWLMIGDFEDGNSGNWSATGFDTTVEPSDYSGYNPNTGDWTLMINVPDDTYEGAERSIPTGYGVINFHITDTSSYGSHKVVIDGKTVLQSSAGTGEYSVPLGSYSNGDLEILHASSDATNGGNIYVDTIWLKVKDKDGAGGTKLV